MADETTLYYYNNNWQILAETDENGTQQRDYIYGNYIDEVLLKTEDGDDLYYAQDHIYSVVALIDDQGNVVERYEYDAYGKPYFYDGSFNSRNQTAYNNVILFCGYRFDEELDKYHIRHRELAPYTGRWVSHDPLGITPNAPWPNEFSPIHQNHDGMNLYEYVKSNSIIYVDFWGLGVYTIGETLPPHPPHDPGAGTFGVDAPPTAKDWASWSSWLSIANAVRLIYPDASWHMRHYLNADGKDLTIRLRKMIKESKIAKNHFYDEINNAMATAEKAPTGMSFNIVGTWTRGGTIDNSNWFYAVGGYRACGAAKVIGLSNCKYRMAFTFHFDDRYNWDTGKSVKIGFIKVTDASLGRLHKVGIAQEFDMNGKTTKTVTWKKGQRFDSNTGYLKPAKSRRR